MKTVYVYSAVPPNSKETIKEYGLLSGVEVAKNKEILKLARPTKKSREDFVKKVEETVASDRPYSVLGPSVLFTMPDESKITDKHFIKEWGLIPVRINLSKLVEDYPETIIWGAELLPIKDKWRKLSDEAFDRKIEQEYGLTWEEFLEARSHELTLADVRKYSKKSPKSLWKDYEKVHIGKMYAANVPHAFIITPMGYIPYAYVEFMNPRENSKGLLYHGSPYLIKKFKPKSHFLAEGKAVVFGTPIIEIAFASMQPWTDDDFEQGIVDDDPPFMIEQYHGAFEKIYGGKQGYLYEIADDTFFTNENLTRFELVSYESPTILARHKFDNVLRLLEATELQMIKYEDGASFRKKGYRQ